MTWNVESKTPFRFHSIATPPGRGSPDPRPTKMTTSSRILGLNVEKRRKTPIFNVVSADLFAVEFFLEVQDPTDFQHRKGVQFRVEWYSTES